jgi:hypothetical protein
VKASDVTDQQLTEYIRSLRRNLADLNKQIRRFLDLPPSPNQKSNNVQSFFASITGDIPALPTSSSPYANSGPPKTHPSAGLSYGRIGSHTFNHPVYGPQSNRTPVQARVVMPRNAGGGFAPLLGVGGFVTDVPASDYTNQKVLSHKKRRELARNPVISGLQYIEPEKVGGSKGWVNPKHASIDAKGRVVLTVEAADPEIVAVHTGTVGDIPDQYQRPAPKINGLPKPANKSSGGYGLGLF